MPTWNPNLYLKFGNERIQPAIDLVAAISSDSPEKIIDLGCGPGNSAALLKKRWPTADITGLDSSSEMIEKARENDPEINWLVSDILDVSSYGNYDLIFSNAALQWIKDLDRLIPALIEKLNPEGVLAIQVPSNEQSPYYQDILQIANRDQWKEIFTDVKNPLTYKPIGYYYDLIAHSCASLRLWETEYCHVMENVEAIVQWISGTGLRPYLDALDSEDARSRFKSEVLESYRKSYPPQSDGKILFPFCRQFILATK